MNEHGTPRDQPTLRVANSWRVLGSVRSAGIASRTHVAAETGLTLTTVHRLIEDLCRRRLLVEGESVERGAVGRPPSTFRFNASIRHVIGVDVGNETTRAGLADLDGTILAVEDRPTAALETDLVGGLAEVVEDLRRAAPDRSDGLVGLGIGVPAVVEDGDRIVRASLHRSWEGLALGSEVRRALGIDAVIAQDDHLAALAELRRGACAGLRNAVVVNVGKGIGAGIVSGGDAYHGSHAAAGRLGWVPMSVGDGESIPASRLVTADGLVADYRRLGGSAPATGALDVFLADAAGDPAAAGAIDLFADRLAWLVGVVVAVVDPELVVIGGGISGSFDRLARPLADRLAESLTVPPAIVASELGTAAGVVGAVEAARARADDWLLRAIEGSA